jgi:hypothetical protein
MKFKNILIAVLFVGMAWNLTLTPGNAAPKGKIDANAQESQPIIIPKEVKSVLDEGMANRQERGDIPFQIVKHLYLPAQQNIHSVFLFSVKNSDLGFTQIPDSEKLQAKSHVFLQFNQIVDGSPGELIIEVYIPVEFEEESSTYDPDTESLCSTGYPLPPGNYLLSMAVTSFELKKIGTKYFEFSLPDAASITESIETTPCFFVKELNRMASPETTVKIHKNFFTYSLLEITPYIDNILPQGKDLDIFFFILGAKPSEDGKFNIEITYEVLKGEEKVIRYAPQVYDMTIISQPLPLKKTVIVKSEEGVEKREQQDLEPGKYSLSIAISDVTSENSTTKNIPFEVSE